MKDNVKELRKVYYNLNNGVITEGDLKDFDFYGNYKYKLMDSDLPFPNGEDFGPSTGDFDKTNYGYINYTFIGRPKNRYNRNFNRSFENGNLYHMNKPIRNQKKLSKLNIILEINEVLPNITIPYGITDVEFFYKGKQYNSVNSNNLKKKRFEKLPHNHNEHEDEHEHDHEELTNNNNENLSDNAFSLLQQQLEQQQILEQSGTAQLTSNSNDENPLLNENLNL